MMCISYNVHDVHLKIYKEFLELLSKLKSIRFHTKPYLSNFVVGIPTFCLSQSTCDICKQPVSQSKCSICKATCLSIYMWHLQATCLSIYMWLWPPHLQATCLSSSTSNCNLISILQATHLSRYICDCNNLQSAADHTDACTKHAPQNQSSQGLLNWNPATTSSRTPETWGECNHLQPDLLLLQQRVELPKTQSQPGSTRHSNCKKLHGCMTHSFDSWESQIIMPSIKECPSVVVNVIRESGVCLQASRRWQAGACMHIEWVVIGCCCSVCEGALAVCLMLCCNWPEAAKIHTARTHSKHRQKLKWALLRWDCQWQMWIWNSWLKNWFWISRAAVAECWSLLL